MRAARDIKPHEDLMFNIKQSPVCRTRIQRKHRRHGIIIRAKLLWITAVLQNNYLLSN